MIEESKKLIKVFKKLNQLSKSKIFSDEEIKEQKENIDDFIETENKLSKILDKLDKLDANDNEVVLHELMNLHSKLSNVEWYANELHELNTRLMNFYNSKLPNDLDQLEEEMGRYNVTKEEIGFVPFLEKIREIDLDDDLDPDPYVLVASKDFIITNAEAGILVFDKNGNFIQKIYLEYRLAIEQVFVQFDSNIIAVMCPVNQRMWLIDLSKNTKQAIDISSLAYLEDVGVFKFYSWLEDRLIFIDGEWKIFKFDIDSKQIQSISEEEINCLYPQFYKYIQEIKKYRGAYNLDTVFPAKYQFSCQDLSTGDLEFVDCKNNLKIKHAYGKGDVHDIFLHNNNFIIPRCYLVNLVTQDAIAFSAVIDRPWEYRHSLFVPDENKLFILRRYWVGDEEKYKIDLFTVNSEKK